MKRFCQIDRDGPNEHLLVRLGNSWMRTRVVLPVVRAIGSEKMETRVVFLIDGVGDDTDTVVAAIR